MVTSVLIVEDEPEFLHRFSQAVTADSQLQLLAAVSNGLLAKALLSAQNPDVMLIDLGLPDISGVEVIRHAAQTCPDCDVLVVTMFADDANVLASIEAGATGYLLKDTGADHIVSSIHQVRSGGSPISPSIARNILTRLRIGTLSPHAETNSVGALPVIESTLLTTREIEILRLIAKGLSFETVSEVLGISAHTVVAHVKSIYKKLAVHSRAEAVYEANQLGLL